MSTGRVWGDWIPVDVQGWQTLTHDWVEHNFPGTTTGLSALGLTEEGAEVAEVARDALDVLIGVGRVSRAVLKQSQGIRGTHADWQAEIQKEVADVFFKLCDLANHSGFGLQSAIRERWEVLRDRDFQADPVGHGLPKEAGL
jgi:NTP pyrophosphatase (non-canonical NTP hydrolase)